MYSSTIMMASMSYYAIFGLRKHMIVGITIHDLWTYPLQNMHTYMYITYLHYTNQPYHIIGSVPIQPKTALIRKEGVGEKEKKKYTHIHT